MIAHAPSNVNLSLINISFISIFFIHTTCFVILESTHRILPLKSYQLCIEILWKQFFTYTKKIEKEIYTYHQNFLFYFLSSTCSMWKKKLQCYYLASYLKKGNNLNTKSNNTYNEIGLLGITNEKLAPIYTVGHCQHPSCIVLEET